MIKEPGPDSRPEETARLFAELTVRFGLDGSAGWRGLGGSRTTNLLVRDVRGRPWVARIHRRSTTSARLAAEQHVRRILAAAGIPAVVAVASARLDSGHWMELEPYVSSDGRMNTAERLNTGFAELARLHDVLRLSDVPVAARTVLEANYIAPGAAVRATRGGAERIRGWNIPHLNRFADSVVGLVEAVTEAELRWDADRVEQVVHGDFWDDNVPFSGSHLEAVLDFGFMAHRLRVDDLALPFWFYLLEPDHGLPGHRERRLLRTLLDTYDRATVQPLSAAERMSIPLIVARQPAWSVGTWVNQLDEDHARRHALDASTELEVAQTVFRDIDLWQAALQ